MKHLNPYIGFDGNCREAMTFYKDCLGGELTMQTVDESPMAAQMPEMKGKIMHSALMKDEKSVLMGSDMTDPGMNPKGNTISLCINCSDKEEIETFFGKLSVGGKVEHPLKEEFWGTFGDLTDKFGIRWMLNLDKPKA